MGLVSSSLFSGGERGTQRAKERNRPEGVGLVAVAHHEHGGENAKGGTDGDKDTAAHGIAPQGGHDDQQEPHEEGGLQACAGGHMLLVFFFRARGQREERR